VIFGLFVPLKGHLHSVVIPLPTLKIFFGKVHTILTSKFSAVSSDCPSGPMIYMSE
jgi:hypothetical protein